MDLGPDKDNIITTRLLIPASEIGCLEGRDGSLSDIQRVTNANVQILPKEDLPPCALEADELIQVCASWPRWSMATVLFISQLFRIFS